MKNRTCNLVFFIYPIRKFQTFHMYSFPSLPFPPFASPEQRYRARLKAGQTSEALTLREINGSSRQDILHPQSLIRGEEEAFKQHTLGPSTRGGA